MVGEAVQLFLTIKGDISIYNLYGLLYTLGILNPSIDILNHKNYISILDIVNTDVDIQYHTP